jgi:uncharacterized protein YaaW (UPF0174 family)
MVPSIDYLTLVVAGAALLLPNANASERSTRFVVGTLGAILFVVGTTRAAMGAFGL